jgi:hypothetical protein
LANSELEESERKHSYVIEVLLFNCFKELSKKKKKKKGCVKIIGDPAKNRMQFFPNTHSERFPIANMHSEALVFLNLNLNLPNEP